MVKKLLAGLAVAGAASLGATLPSYAATTPCYVGCSPGPIPTGSVPGVPQDVHTRPVGTPQEPSPGLPFTGADIAESAALAVVLVTVGGVLLVVSRRSARRAH